MDDLTAFDIERNCKVRIVEINVDTKLNYAILRKMDVVFLDKNDKRVSYFSVLLRKSIDFTFEEHDESDMISLRFYDYVPTMDDIIFEIKEHYRASYHNMLGIG